MDSSTSAAAADKSLSEVEEEISKLVGQRIVSSRPYIERDTPRPQIERDTSRAQIERGHDIERIISSVARLTSSSIEGLQDLTSELHGLQKFLKTEVTRVQSEVDNALAGIKIIIETIAPWRSIQTSGATPTTGRTIRSDHAATVSVEGLQPRL
jgi:hypothetical protein